MMPKDNTPYFYSLTPSHLKIDLKEIQFGGVDWIHLAQDRGQWRALAKTVMNNGSHKTRVIS
jgi:hypothetical protein